jgi:hypothetical protein
MLLEEISEVSLGEKRVVYNDKTKGNVIFQDISPLSIELRPTVGRFLKIHDKPVFRCEISLDDSDGMCRLRDLLKTSLRIKAWERVSLFKTRRHPTNGIQFGNPYIDIKVPPDFKVNSSYREFSWKEVSDRQLEVFVFFSIRNISLGSDHTHFAQSWLDVCYLKSPPWSRQEKLVAESHFLSSYIENPDNEDKWKKFNNQPKPASSEVPNIPVLHQSSFSIFQQMPHVSVEDLLGPFKH